MTPATQLHSTIGVIDLGFGNFGSIMNMLRRLRLEARSVHTAADLKEVDRIILPGVGAFDSVVRSLRAADLILPLEDAVRGRGKPCLGICVGMQLLGRGSEEGNLPGLTWIDAEVRHFELPPGIKVPHMGWSYVRPTGPHPLSAPLQEHSRYYFVHSYHMVCDRSGDRLLEAGYGGRWFTAAIVTGNIAGVQFHPEKSHHYGMNLLSAFASWTPEPSL